MFQKKSVFDKIENHLKKKGHQLCMSIFLSNYNGNNIYVRFDYVPKYSVYKIVWFDFNFFVVILCFFLSSFVPSEFFFWDLNVGFHLRTGEEDGLVSDPKVMHVLIHPFLV